MNTGLQSGDAGP